MNYKKIAALSLTSLLLFSCNDTKNDDGYKDNTVTIVDSFFNELKKGYILDSVVTETINGETAYFITESQHNQDDYTYLVYDYATSASSVNKNVLKTSDTIYPLVENGVKYVATGRLNLNNEVKKYKINYVNAGYGKYDELGFKNLFSYIDASSFSTLFTKINNVDNAYSLNEDQFNKEFGKAIITQLYGQPGLNLDSFALEFNKDGIATISATANYTGTKGNYSFIFDTTIVSKGDVDFKYTFEPYANVEDSDFNKFIANVNKHNYTMYVQNYVNEVEISDVTLKLNNDKLSYQIEDKQEDETASYNMIKTSEGKYFYVNESIGDETTTYTYGAETGEETFNAVIPSMKLSRNVFDYDSDSLTYSVKNNVYDELDSIVPFEVSAETINELTMQLFDYDGYSQYIITNKNGNNTTYITISDVGSTTFDFNEGNIKTDTSVTTWEKSLFDSEDDYNTLLAFLNNDMSNLPLPSGMNAEGYWMIGGEISSEEGVDLLYLGSTTVDDDVLYDYYLALMASGWEIDEDNECFYKTINNNKIKLTATAYADGSDNYMYITMTYITQ